MTTKYEWISQRKKLQVFKSQKLQFQEQELYKYKFLNNAFRCWSDLWAGVKSWRILKVMRTKSLIFYSILDKLFKTRKDKPKNALILVFWNTERKHKKLEVKERLCKITAKHLSAINRIIYIYIYIIINYYRTEYDLQLSSSQ